MASTRPVNVKSTKILQNSLPHPQFNAIKDEFERWKSLGSQGIDQSYLFGRDGAYRPPICSKYQLRHVHLIPAGIPTKMKDWEAAWKSNPRQEKTSDRALLYAQDGNNFLLIAILEYPTAHSVIKMQTQADKDLMLEFVRIADLFIDSGKIDK